MERHAWRVSAALVVALVLEAGMAYAERSYKVRIETEPEGAEVFIDDPDSDPLGETPYDTKLEAGSYTLVFKAPGHETKIESIEVNKSRRRQTFLFELDKQAMAFLKLRPLKEGEDFEDSTILIDDVEKSVEPDEKIEVSAGAHKIEVVREGYETFEAYVDLEEGQLQGVSVVFETKGAGGDDDDGDVVVKKKKEKGGPTEPATVNMLTAWGGFEWGGRDFKYDDTATMLRDYNFLGARFRTGAVVHPLISMGRWAGGVGIGASVGMLIAPRTSRNDAGTPSDPDDDLNANNSWFDYKVDLRYRYDFAELYWAGASVGYGQDKFTFETSDTSLAGRLAAVDYKMLQFGAMGGARIEVVDLFMSLALYQVSEAGEVQSRFTSAAVSAFGLGFGGSVPIYEGVDLTALLQYDRFSYTFGEPVSGADYTAQSAVDQFFGLTVGVGYRM